MKIRDPNFWPAAIGLSLALGVLLGLYLVGKHRSSQCRPGTEYAWRLDMCIVGEKPWEK